MSLPVIELTNISFGYNGKPILDDVSLVVEREILLVWLAPTEPARVP